MEPKQESEVDKFFENLPTKDNAAADIFDERPKAEAEPAADGEDEPDGRKNRRHRRLEEKLQQERDANIALTERIKVLSEQKESSRESRSAEVSPDLVKVFGDTDAGREIARIMEKREEDILSRAEERALERLMSAQGEEEKEVKRHEASIESKIEELEDRHGIDMSSGTRAANHARSEYLSLVSSLSPKDDEGNITSYADFDSAFDVYQRTRDKPDASRNKELASRTMQKSGSVNPQRTADDAGKRWLRSIGIKVD